MKERVRSGRRARERQWKGKEWMESMRLVAACGYGDSIEIGGSMFWRAMEGLPEGETLEGERDGEHEREWKGKWKGRKKE